MKIFFIGIAITCCVYAAKAQLKVAEANAPDKIAQIDRLIKKEMDQQHIFGLSLAVVKDGKLVLMQGYGLSNIEQGIPASSETIYKIGSVSKQMIATATMLLIQQGKLKLSDSLPKFFKGAPETWNSITIRHLLNHTSGLPREAPLQDNMKDQPDSVLIPSAYTIPLLFKPGTKWRYCNLGYFMLADIIRQLSGQTFPDFMQTEIFYKNNLLNTRTTSVSAIVKNRAGEYVYQSKDSIYNAKDYLALRPSGAFLSSVSDMVKWEMMIQNHRLLTKENWNKMWSDTVRTGDSDKQPIDYYGYGWDVSKYKNLNMVHHDGTLPGFSSSYLRFVESNSTIIVLTNADNTYPKKIALSVADILFSLKDQKQ